VEKALLIPTAAAALLRYLDNSPLVPLYAKTDQRQLMSFYRRSGSYAKSLTMVILGHNVDQAGNFAQTHAGEKG